MGRLLPTLRSAFQRLLVSPRLVRSHEFLFKVAVHGLGLLNYQDPFASGETHFVEKVLPRLVYRPDPVFVDVGAHRGRFSVTLASRFPRARIHAIEPHPANVERLKELGLPTLRVHALALGGAEKPTILYDREGSTGSEHASVYSEVIVELHGVGSVATEIYQETLDSFASRNGIQHIDFLKLDVEGAELEVLRGATELLQRRAIEVLLFEFNEMNVVSRTFLRDFESVLPKFSFFRLLPRGLLPVPKEPLLRELFGYQNILACRAPGSLGE